jgi:hypothetical protein
MVSGFLVVGKGERLEDLVGGFRKKDGWLVTSGRKDKEKDECLMTTVGDDGGRRWVFSLTVGE